MNWRTALRDYLKQDRPDLWREWVEMVKHN